jgi:hypothetical protein
MSFLKTNQPDTFLNLSAIATVQFLKHVRTEPLRARGLPDIPMEGDEEITGAEITTVAGNKITLQAEDACKLRRIIAESLHT